MMMATVVLAAAIAKVSLHLGYIAVCWLFLYSLYRKNVFFKVSRKWF